MRVDETRRDDHAPGVDDTARPHAGMGADIDNPVARDGDIANISLVALAAVIERAAADKQVGIFVLGQAGRGKQNGRNQRDSGGTQANLQSHDQLLQDAAVTLSRRGHGLCAPIARHHPRHGLSIRLANSVLSIRVPRASGKPIISGTLNA
jgi:hypothetical protein